MYIINYLLLLLCAYPLVFSNLHIVKAENLTISVRNLFENIHNQPNNITDVYHTQVHHDNLTDAYEYREIVLESYDEHAIVTADSRDHHVDSKYEPTYHHEFGNVDNIYNMVEVHDGYVVTDVHNHSNFNGAHADDIDAYNLSSNSAIRKDKHKHSSPSKHHQSNGPIRTNGRSSRLHHIVTGAGPVIDRITYKIVSTSSSSSSNSHVYDSSTIHIVYSSDMLMIPFTMLSVASVINRSANASRLCFHFVLIDLRWDTRFLNELKLSMGGLSSFESVTWDPMPHVIRKMKIRKRERQDLAAAANYARFYISKLFPLLDRFIYLDNDVMAHRSIHELWEINISNYKLGMVHDCGHWFQEHVVKLKNYNISHPTVMGIFGPEVLNHTCHPNAGIMLVNQQLIKRQGDLSIIEKLIELNEEEFVYKLGSQPLVVLTSWNQYLPLDMEWNIRTTAYKFRHHNKEPGIFHFTGKGRKSVMIRIFLSLLIEDKDEFTALRSNFSSNFSFINYFTNTTSLDLSSMHYNLNNSGSKVDGFHPSIESLDNSLGEPSIVDSDQAVKSIHTGSEEYNILGNSSANANKTIDHHQLRKDQIEYNKAEQREENMYEAYWKCVFNDMIRNGSSPIFKFLKHILTKQMVYYQRMNPSSWRRKRRPLLKEEDSNQQRNSHITQSTSIITTRYDTIHHGNTAPIAPQQRWGSAVRMPPSTSPMSKQHTEYHRQSHRNESSKNNQVVTVTTILGRDHQLKAQQQQALMIMKHQTLKKQKLVLEKHHEKVKVQ